MYVSEIHRHILDCIRRRKRKHIISISPQKWMQDVMIVVFFFFFPQNEALNSALVLEIRSLSQLSSVFRNAWLREPKIKIQSDIIRQKGILVGYSTCSMSTVFSNYQISILWNTQRKKIGWVWNNSGCISLWMFTLSLHKAHFEIIRSRRRRVLCDASLLSSPGQYRTRSVWSDLHNLL